MTFNQARNAGLAQLTVWGHPEEPMKLAYGYPTRHTESITYGAWLEQERVRIASDRTRVATLVASGKRVALFVDCVAPHCLDRDHKHARKRPMQRIA